MSSGEDAQPHEARDLVEPLARRHGIDTEAALALLRAVAEGGGGMAQFDHPGLGGMGQWSRGGMTMIGAMSGPGLRDRVGALADDLSALLDEQPELAQRRTGSGRGASGDWWPAELGRPSATGSQDGGRYAVFPAARRLAVERDGRLTLHDTGDHVISGASQAQGGAEALAFASQHGPVRLDDLPVVEGASPSAPVGSPGRPDRSEAPSASSSRSEGDDALGILERLAELHRKGVLTEEEFRTKKAEILGRI